MVCISFWRHKKLFFNFPKIVASAGYEAAFTIQSKRVLPNQNLFLVGRDALSPDTPMDEWKNRLAGGREL